MTDVVFYFRGTDVIHLINSGVESYFTLYTQKISGWLNILRLKRNTKHIYQENCRNYSYTLGVGNEFSEKGNF